ncbi:SDR family NAD(P)-dependent oxidoreductase [Nonomuraea sp. SYSU D8015]|uniref:SDR family NAD(P)-dependent oxidoreductase n=1 Tax=Nonomuraea sp. SYSU D8015 TaxID=2593644 RepID=UPI0021CE390E|nr:SDR family NAD(P)-dependent oxidoreductase [Nonomuraea sp. SYSU D8015]
MGYVHGARAVLPYLRNQGSGMLVNVSSVAGVVAKPYTAAYCMSKFALRSLSTSLRQELRLEGDRKVKVCTVLPGSIDTPLFQQAANYSGRQVRALPPVYSPDRMAGVIVGVVRWPRREVVTGPRARNLVMQSKLVPGFTERLLARQMDRRHLFRDRTAALTSGNLYEPALGPGSVDGGWHGRRKTAVRRTLTAAALTTGAVACARRVLR